MMTTLELPFEDRQAPELDAFIQEMDQALDAGFLGEIDEAFTRAAAAEDDEVAILR